ncbi:MAG: hypothetical protein KAQ68_06435 [Clostridiales bacterium]|nr:hypothetical protein [Clostridiales bacterium]
MKVIYKRIMCNISFKNSFKVEILKASLILTRLSRIMRRLLSYAKPLIVVIVCMILYIFIVFRINYREEYLSILDAFWDLRNTIFTVLVLSYFVNVSARERDYRTRIRIRHNVYCHIMFEYQDCIEKILETLGKKPIEPFCLYSSESIKKIKHYIGKEMNRNKTFISYENNYTRLIEYLSRLMSITQTLMIKKDTFNSSWDLGHNGAMFEYYIETLPSSIQKAIDNMKYSPVNIKQYTEFLKDFKSIVYDIEKLIEHIRIPWRIDVKKHLAIVKLIYPENKKKLEDDYYLSLLFNLK